MCAGKKCCQKFHELSDYINAGASRQPTTNNEGIIEDCAKKNAAGPTIIATNETPIIASAMGYADMAKQNQLLSAQVQQLQAQLVTVVSKCNDSMAAQVQRFEEFIAQMQRTGVECTPVILPSNVRTSTDGG